MKKITRIFVIILISVIGVYAETPEEVVKGYFNEMQQSDMSYIAERMHNDELKKFKKMLLPIFDEAYQTEEDAEMFQAFFKGDDRKTVRKFTPKKFFARFMTWINTIQPELQDILKKSEISPIGHVIENDQVHVVLRTTIEYEGLTITKLSVMSLKKEKNEWKLLLTGEIKNLAQVLKTQSELKKKTQQ